MIDKLIFKLENQKLSFLQIIGVIFSIIYIRYFLEMLSNTFHNKFISGYESTFLQIPLFFLVLLLIMILLVYFFTRIDIIKITNLFVLTFPIILIAPIIDIFYGGISSHYVQLTSLDEILPTIFNPFHIGDGISPGVWAETTMIIIFVFFYIQLKTKSFLKAFFASSFIYLSIKLIAGFPVAIYDLVLGNLLQVSPLRSISKIFLQNYTFDVKISIYFFILLFLCIMLYLQIYNREKFYYFLGYLSVTRVIHYLIILNLGIALGYLTYTFDQSGFDFVLIFLTNLLPIFIWLFAKNLNDRYDVLEDRISNKNNPYLSKLFNKEELDNLNYLLLVIIFFNSLIISYDIFILTIIILALTYVYSVPPLRLKRFVFISHATIALVSSLIFLMGLILVKGNQFLSGYEPDILMLVFLIYFLTTHVKDIKDFEGDRKGKILTLPSILGLKKSKLVIFLFVSISCFLPYIVFRDFLILLFASAFSFLFYYAFNQTEYSEKLIFVLEFIYMIILITTIIS